MCEDWFFEILGFIWDVDFSYPMFFSIYPDVNVILQKKLFLCSKSK